MFIILLRQIPFNASLSTSPGHFGEAYKIFFSLALADCSHRLLLHDMAALDYWSSRISSELGRNGSCWGGCIGRKRSVGLGPDVSVNLKQLVDIYRGRV